MSDAKTSVVVDGFGLIERPDPTSSPRRRCYEIVRRYTMTNEANSSVRLITWGAGIQSVRVPNDKGILGDVVLGFDSMDGYSEDSGFAEIMGKVTNQVSSSKNCSDCCNDEGKKWLRPFENRNWDSCVVGKEVVMSNVSDVNHDGFYGTTLTQVKFSWTDDNQLHVSVRATSTKPVPTNVTSRCLFNLAGHGMGSKELRKHVVTVNASEWSFADVRDRIPRGDFRSVYSTIYDLRFPTLLNSKRLSLVPGGGYDHHLRVDTPSIEGCYRFHARILHPGCGRFLEVYSNQPGIRFNTLNEIAEPGRSFPPDFEDCRFIGSGDKIENTRMSTRFGKVIRGKDGVVYQRHGGFFLSPQNHPDTSGNVEGSPTNILHPGKIYAHDTVYKFGVVRRI